MAEHLRGEIELEAHELPRSIMTPAQIKAIRLKVASSTGSLSACLEFQRGRWSSTSRDDAISTARCAHFCVSLIANPKLLVAPSQANLFDMRRHVVKPGRAGEPVPAGDGACSPSSSLPSHSSRACARLITAAPDKGEIVMAKTPAAKDPTRNVWLQLGFPDAEEHYLKAQLVFRLDKAIKSLGLTQRVAARRIGTTQPELSKSWEERSPRFRLNG